MSFHSSVDGCRDVQGSEPPASADEIEVVQTGAASVVVWPHLHLGQRLLQAQPDRR
ncbi:hypothetical protein [Streptomyces spiramenti]|uniref:Uncharacterized protein n=1 Tax=Streptomyces spiramenti TaxID=2720606 RepID=A0ABX1AUB4_9ACTN|nr:hypothetical protein [Streptomyces spiramenti]NJP68388.1 hypothetical protein [Streptomyces spiramenti]